MANTLTAPPPADTGTSGIDAPHPVHDLRQLPAELAKDRWVVYAHEWLPDGIDLRSWEIAVSALCEAAGVAIGMTTDIRERATVVMNMAAMPSLAQIEASVAAIQRFREKA